MEKDLGTLEDKGVICEEEVPKTNKVSIHKINKLKK